ncbi:putative ubiquitin-conjugating enzyme E2, ubiquitin-conjugating enzyme/RWD [Helianthus anomalus]
MDLSPIATYTPRKSKKRVFPGSSSSYTEPDVIEITPLADQSSKTKGRVAQKEVVFHEIIDVDLDEDGEDLSFLGENGESNKKMKGISLGSSSASKLDAKKVESTNKGKEIPNSSKSFNPKSNYFDLDEYVFDDDYSKLQSLFDNVDLPTGVEAPIPWLQDSVQMKKTTPGNPFVSSNAVSEASGSQSNRETPSSSRLAGSSSRMTKPVNDEVMKMLQGFKKFDTVMDHSDHHYATTQPPKRCAKKIQEEWRILEKDLPDTIFVRVYESRMDLLRAVIIGAEGTPYHDGLFFFDVCFPTSYPKKPPLVHYHSGGLRINPNLYNCGKVCLSLLNTWTGVKQEKWVPGKSTMLQVLVSIQGLILNMKPYFNEPGFARSSGSVHGEQASLHYNENTLILSLKTMVYTMKKPPKNFEDLVVGHFRNCVVDILMACKAYTEGVQVGCLVKGGVQDVDEDNSKCSQQFRNDVASYSKTLIAEFMKIGAKEAEEFLHLSIKN